MYKSQNSNFRHLEGILPITCGAELATLDTQSILCTDTAFLRIAPFAPCVLCEFEGEAAYITCAAISCGSSKNFFSETCDARALPLV